MDESMTLADGRTLEFRSLGDPRGRLLFFFHGTPGSRLAVAAGDPLARVPGLRVITPDRPGFGRSDPKPDRVLLDWARDIVELADHLGTERFMVAGVSGGGPHALACACAIPDRVTLTLAVSSPAPAGFRGATRGMSMGNRLGLLLGRVAPSAVRRIMRASVGSFEKDPERFLDTMASQMAPADRTLLADRSVRDAHAV